MKPHYFTFWMTFSLPLPSSLLKLSIRDPQTRGRYFFPYSHSQKIDTPDNVTDKTFKTQSIGTLSNFDFQWTKILYQNNLKHIAYKVQGFCPLKIKITQFPDGFLLNIS